MSRSKGSITNIANYLTNVDWDLTEFKIRPMYTDDYIDISLRLQLPNDSSISKENHEKLTRWIDLANLYHSARRS